MMHFISKILKQFADSRMRKCNDVRYLNVLKNGIHYEVTIGPDKMNHKQLSDLIFYAVKYLAEQLGLDVQSVMFFLIAYFEHIETGKNLEDISDEYSARCLAEITNGVKIDA